jgi:hypothetical protein
MRRRCRSRRGGAGSVDGQPGAAGGADRGAAGELGGEAGVAFVHQEVAGEADRPTTVETIATRYLHFVDVYLSARVSAYVE